MMKYRGPKDEYRLVERSYFRKIAIGLVLIVIGIVIDVFAASLGTATVTTVDVEGVENVMKLTPGNSNVLVSIAPILIGVVLNVYAVKKYRTDYSEMKEKFQRPEGKFVGIGLGLTAIVTVVGLILIAVT
jgi:uncharacterized membrane protein YidH (DUF202 family)